MNWTRPRALRSGDLVGVCAPAGPVDRERLDRGVAELQSLGFRVRVPDGILECERFMAGSLERRLRELQGLFCDGEVAGIVAARGGAGAGQLLPHLETELLRAHPKVFVGYSDLTFLHTHLNNLGLVTFHGPMVARDFGPRTYHRQSFLQAVCGDGGPYASEEDDLLPLRPGSGEGRLRGGCLSILAGAAGTPWALRPDSEGTLLFLEDVDEAPYRIDRMLRQLRSSGALASVKGIVFGDLRGCSPVLEAGFSLEEVLLQALEGLDVPIALGLSSGHTASPNVTLPLGARARLECSERASFRVLESAVA
jgi:muramoyltetrapeptide carboxypeptidase